MKRLVKITANHLDIVVLVVFIVIAGILRFSNITKLEFFTYDQARDALFVKRMIVDHEWRLLGTQTSLPGMYLPPFYFYTIAPILWLFKLNPIGIDIYSAFIGVLTVPLVYLVGNKIFGKPAGIFSAGLFAVSPLVVELTRRAWNPNTLPFFILLSFYFIYCFVKDKKIRDLLIGFTVYGYCLSLHFGAWLLMPLYGFLLVYGYYRKNFGVKTVLGSLGIVFLFVVPLILFNVKHDFILLNQAKIFFFDGGHIGAKDGNIIEPFFSSLIAIFTILISGKIMVGYGAPFEFTGKIKELFYLSQPISVIAQKPFSISFQWWGLLIFILIFFFTFININSSIRNRSYKNEYLGLFLVSIWAIWGILASRLYSGFFAFFYYLYLFPVPILFFGYLFKKGFDEKYLKHITVVMFLLIMLFHLKNTSINQHTWRNINDMQQVAKVISNNVDGGKPFNIVTIQRDLDRWDRNSVDYRYFVESFNNKRALDWYPQDYQNAQTLFVVDETGKSDPLVSPIMEILEFKPEKIVDKWEVEKNIVIYKIEK